jgi:hypothetical protein
MDKHSAGEESFGDAQERMSFAEAALQRLHCNCPEAAVDGMVRVYIMCSGSSWVVVEFETYGAGIYGKRVAETESFMRSFWTQKFAFFLYQLLTVGYR